MQTSKLEAGALPIARPESLYAVRLVGEVVKERHAGVMQHWLPLAPALAAAASAGLAASAGASPGSSPQSLPPPRLPFRIPFEHGK